MILRQRPLSTIYDNLSLTNSTLFTADTILRCTKNLFPIHDFHFISRRKNHNSLLLLCPLCSTWTPAHPLHHTYISLHQHYGEKFIFQLQNLSSEIIASRLTSGCLKRIEIVLLYDIPLNFLVSNQNKAFTASSKPLLANNLVYT